MSGRNLWSLAITALVVYVVASGIWQNVERRRREMRLRQQLTPSYSCFLTNVDGYLTCLETHGIYIVYDRTMTEVSKNGNLSSPKGVWLRPEIAESRLKVVPYLRVEDRTYELKNNTICWMTKHKGIVQMTVRPFHVEHFVEDFADFVEGYCQTQRQCSQSNTFSTERNTFKKLSLAGGNIIVAYSALHNIWILSKGVFSEDEIMVQPSPMSSEMLTVRIAGVEYPLKENMLYMLTNHNGEVRIDEEPFELFNLLIRIESSIYQSCHSQKTETTEATTGPGSELASVTDFEK